MKRDKCLICDSRLSLKDLLLSLPNMPASAQNIPAKDELDSDHSISLNMFQCPCCGLVQLDAEPVNYYRQVIRAGGETSTMVNLRRQEYSDFVKQFKLEGKRIVEIGCGRGEFLKEWKGFPVEAYGIEYDQKLVDSANQSGLQVYKSFAEDGQTELSGTPYDAFVQFNFLEHQPYPNEMLQCIYNNLTNDGVGLVTVPSLEYILKYDGYYELIRDHIAYYSKQTLCFLFEKNGFEVVSHKIVNRDTHEIMVRKRQKVSVDSWKQNFEELKSEIDAYIGEYYTKGKKIAIWGASHQGFTIASSMRLQSKVAYIIDSAVFKQGKYAPASHIPIYGRERYFKEPVDSILILAPGYTDEIAQIIRTELNANIDIRTIRSNHLEKL